MSDNTLENKPLINKFCMPIGVGGAPSDVTMETFVSAACKKSSYTKSNIAHACGGSAFCLP